MAYESNFDVESLDERLVPFAFGRVFFDCGDWVSTGYGMGKQVEDLRSMLVWTPKSAVCIWISACGMLLMLSALCTVIAWISACEILFTLSAAEQRRDEGNSTWTRRHRH